MKTILLIIGLVLMIAIPVSAKTVTWQCRNCGKILHGGYTMPAGDCCPANNDYPHVWQRVG